MEALYFQCTVMLTRSPGSSCKSSMQNPIQMDMRLCTLSRCRSSFWRKHRASVHHGAGTPRARAARLETLFRRTKATSEGAEAIYVYVLQEQLLSEAFRFQCTMVLARPECAQGMHMHTELSGVHSRQPGAAEALRLLNLRPQQVCP